MAGGDFLSIFGGNRAPGIFLKHRCSSNRTGMRGMLRDASVFSCGFRSLERAAAGGPGVCGPASMERAWNDG